MTVEELIEKLQKENPKAQVLLHFRRYTKFRHISRATRPVSYPIRYLKFSYNKPGVFLVADQKGDYG